MIGDEPPEEPKLSIVASNSVDAVTDEWDRERCLWHIDFWTRQFAGNLLRVIRGAGKPHRLLDDLAELHSYIANAPPGVTWGMAHDTIQEALADGRRAAVGTFGDEMAAVEAGALRAVAGRILQQQLQASAGNRDLWEAYYALERAREELRKQREAEARAARLPKSRARRAKAMRAIVAKKPDDPPPEEPDPPPFKGSTADFMRKNRRR